MNAPKHVQKRFQSTSQTSQITSAWHEHTTTSDSGVAQSTNPSTSSTTLSPRARAPAASSRSYTMNLIRLASVSLIDDIRGSSISPIDWKGRDLINQAIKMPSSISILTVAVSDWCWLLDSHEPSFAHLQPMLRQRPGRKSNIIIQN
jgi:hypothetical protein